MEIACSPDEPELALDSLDVLGLIVADEKESAWQIMELIKEKDFRGRFLSATLSCKAHSYSLRTFTIMWMYSLGGCVGKILKTVLEGPNLSANFERSCPRSSIRLARVLSGSVAIGLESLT